MIPVHKLDRASCELAFHNHKTGKALGKGAYGTVYELCDRQNKCPYVLKVQAFKPMRDLIEQFQREIVTQITVSERLGITPAVYDAWYCRPNARQINAFIVMERMDGDLVSYLKAHARTLSNDFIRHLVGTIKGYVSQLHKLQIKHNDIADRNILYKRMPDGRLKWVLGDWGLSMYVFHRQMDRRTGRLQWFFDDRRIAPSGTLATPFAMSQTEKDRDDIKSLERQLRMIQARGVYTF
jgi:serine/threonine protein kinase